MWHYKSKMDSCSVSSRWDKCLIFNERNLFFLLKYVLDFSNGGPIIPSPPSTIISYQIIFKEGGLQRTWWAAWTLTVAEEREIIGRDGVPFGASGVVWKVIGFSLRPWGIEECLERKGAWTTVYSTLIENEAGWLFLYCTNTFPPGRVFLMDLVTLFSPCIVVFCCYSCCYYEKGRSNVARCPHM